MKAKNGKEITEINDPSILEFLSLKKKGTKRTYESYFRRLMDFEPNLNGKKMLEEKDVWERTKIIQFKRHLEEKGFSENMQKSAIGAIRGFYSHNRKPLFFSQSEKKEVNTAQNETEGIFFSRDEIIRMWNLSTLSDLSKWVLCNKTMGLRASDFAKITFGQLRGIDLTKEAPIFFGKVNTGKESVIANVFWDSDVIHTVQELLELHKDAKNSDKVFPHREDYLSRILLSLANKAQINIGTKECSFHAMRRFLYTKLTTCMSDDQAKIIVGKKVKENPYLNKDETELRELFKKVLPEISINGNGAIKAVKAEVHAQGETIEQLVKLLSERDKTIANLKAQQTQNQNMMSKLLTLPTIAKEMEKAKEKVEFT
jgi:site-specific recombinase XerD